MMISTEPLGLNEKGCEDQGGKLYGWGPSPKWDSLLTGRKGSILYEAQILWVVNKYLLENDFYHFMQLQNTKSEGLFTIEVSRACNRLRKTMQHF